ncbi:hypothetical protein Ahu01nite_024430 [Winogradskya humida]|uniref:Rhamnogalacturonase A/B/Epimerase-like pectate lyase domain-containing protein n=2 Tax=Winogradskya humida TaxID=113566 RepID=A0ABQ3ZL71_9ACTN|nr:hypothetical protein Ahu01nite_024430 [Actinoplanes humidus]
MPKSPRSAVLGMALLSTLATQVVFTSAGQAANPAAAGYSLTPAFGDPTLTAADCAADPSCVVATIPRGNGLDDWSALTASIATAAGRATSAQPATVFLPAGVYSLTRPLRLPPNVNLRGSGMTATTLTIAAGSHPNFNYSFLVRPDDTTVANSTNLVADLAVNGNCKVGAGLTGDAVLPSATCDHGAGDSAGGGIKTGDRWTVEHVRFTNLEYFKLWVNSTTGVRILDNRFDNLGGSGSGAEDNIGGGGFASDTVVTGNQFDATERGNSLDFTNARGLTFTRNVVYTDPAMLARYDRDDNGSLYLEAVTDSTITDNVFTGGHIVLKSNAGYTPTGNNKNVTNPARIVVRGNRITASYGAGITVTYTDYLDADGTTGRVDGAVDASDTTNHTLWSGGGNVISDNVIDSPAESGVLVYGCYEAAKSVADTIAGNTVSNAGTDGSSSYSTGCGTFETVGVGLSIGKGDGVYGNVATGAAGSPAVSGAWYGIQIGSRTAKTVPTGTVLTDPTGVYPANRSDSVIVGPYRYGRGTPESPVVETGVRTPGGAALTWRESTALSGVPVVGYRVYRAGALVADLPVGSVTIPGNLMSEEAATLETGLGGWTAVAKSTVSRTTGVAAPGVGASSLAITAGAAGQIGANGPMTPVTPGQTYTAVASYRAGAQATARKARTGVVWLDASGTAVSSRLFTANTATVDATDRWTTSSFTAQAPAGAAYARVISAIDSAAAGEIHLMDRIGLVAGAATEGWTDPATPTGPTTYQVVAVQSTSISGSEYSIPVGVRVG